ncbi:MAG: prephenate dehydratase [Sedimentisphaeraceae bacterium JB056]
MPSLEELRKQIDSIDQQLVKLLNERARVVVEVGKYKKRTGAAPIYAPDREKAVLEKICGLNEGPLPDKTLLSVWRELMSGSFFLERPLRIGFLGPRGSYSHQAAMMKFGQSVEYNPITDIQGVFDEVARDQCDFGVVPIENSTGGGIVETLDALIGTKLMICAEMEMAIHHNLLANCSLGDIEKIYSKPEVFAQCRKWLAETGNQDKTIAEASTAQAAQLASGSSNAAAIGSNLAGKLYGLNIICENIEDNVSNTTRFLILSKKDTPRTGDDKTMLMFTTAHKPGSLFEVLSIFDKYDINLTRIESRPNSTRTWEYHFFVELAGHRTDESIKKAVAKLRDKTLQVSILGSYPKFQSFDKTKNK